jgi:hypothetical protein
MGVGPASAQYWACVLHRPAVGLGGKRTKGLLATLAATLTITARWLALQLLACLDAAAGARCLLDDMAY